MQLHAQRNAGGGVDGGDDRAHKVGLAMQKAVARLYARPSMALTAGMQPCEEEPSAFLMTWQVSEVGQVKLL